MWSSPKIKEAYRNGHFAEDFTDGRRIMLQQGAQVDWAACLHAGWDLKGKVDASPRKVLT